MGGMLGAMGGAACGGSMAWAAPQEPGERPRRSGGEGIEILNPGGRVPVSFVIDDSTCLVNLAHFAMPQFAEAWKRDRYDRPWRDWPREIPDSFVRRFGEFCREEGVRGKYSVVPYPACVGWVDRDLPGWSRGELRDSLSLVREFLAPDWDIHPEMISHTRVIDTRTGRPFPPKPDGSFWMENGGWCEGKSVDQIAEYITYALQILKNVDLPCEGFTTPGGFGNPAKGELSRAGIEAVRSVFGAEIPHYFKYVETRPGESTQPKVEFAAGLDTDAPECIVNLPACTGDWFGGWDGTDLGDEQQSVDRFLTEDARQGRLVEVIEAGDPAAFLCHWPGLYCHGQEGGYRIFQEVVRRLNRAYGKRIRWMKLSEMARYWAAKELTDFGREGEEAVWFDAPFASPDFTVRISGKRSFEKVDLLHEGKTRSLERREVQKASDGLETGQWRRLGDSEDLEICCDLPRGRSRLHFS